MRAENSTTSDLFVIVNELIDVPTPLGVEPGQLQAEDQPHRPHRLPEHSDRLSRWLPVCIWWKGNLPLLVDHQMVYCVHSDRKIQLSFQVCCDGKLYMHLLNSDDTRGCFWATVKPVDVKSDEGHVELVGICHWSVVSVLRTVRPCCGTWMRANTSTLWIAVTSSTPCASAPTVTGSVPPLAPALRSGWVLVISISQLE